MQSSGESSAVIVVEDDDLEIVGTKPGLRSHSSQVTAYDRFESSIAGD